MVDKKRLLNKLKIISFTKLAKHLGVTRGNIYYHYKNLKNGKLTFKNEVIKKISLFISDKDDIFFD